jgi:cobalt-zinc-cadmium efflux system protein
VPAVHDVHHVHVWQLTGGSRVATLHAVLVPGHQPDPAIRAVREALHEAFAIDHVTVQLDGVVCAQPDCAVSAAQTGHPVHGHTHAPTPAQTHRPAHHHDHDHHH